jgi:nucleoside-diphosphate-sugar epimerase/glycosyltransferase involved in cell wall biosynthesis
MTMQLEEKIKRMRGPLVVLGASGFVGANLLKLLLRYREDVYGTVFHTPAWRLEDVPLKHVIQSDLLVDSNLEYLFNTLEPKTIFNCVAYGAYSFETQSDWIYQTNFNLTAKLLHRLSSTDLACYVHSGSSSEYGDKASAPDEDVLPEPNSDYAVSKVASANLIRFFGKKKLLPCANLRLYALYGPLEDSARLIPNLVRQGSQGKYPEFVNPEISRDFVYVDDACEAFIDTALNLKPADYGESFNIGSGKKTTIREVAKIAGELFNISEKPAFESLPDRKWDVTDWYADTKKAKVQLGWEAKVSFREGLQKSKEWYEALPDKEKYRLSSKQFGLDGKYSISAVVACYKDVQAIPIMHQRLKAVFEKLQVDYEIIFVNDNSPDDSESVIAEISRQDRRVKGISHSRNFGSQSAFRSGMEIAAKNSCVLLDGDLQDPPELIEEFVEKWKEGYDVIFGRRVKRQASLLMQVSYKSFYWVFNKFSYLPIPRDAGDFSLIDRRAVEAILQFPERDFFLRGVRAYVGFKQIGVDYARPERLFGVTTNSFFKNVEWAKKGILSFSYTPLSVLSTCGVLLFGLTILLGLVQFVMHFLFPDAAPKGVTSILLAVLFFGSVNLFALAVVGEYIAKIFEEVKQRPHFVRRAMIKNGEVRAVSTDRSGKDRPS